MTVTLRPYQVAAATAAWHALTAGQNPVVVMATGTGKSPTFACVARWWVDSCSSDVAVVAHRQELLDQARRHLREAGVPDHRAHIMSIQSLYSEDARPPEGVGLVVYDECFPAGTMVDGRAIESLNVGDLVRSYNHTTNTIELRPIKRLFKSLPSSMVTLHLSNGRRVTCTPGHPFWDGSRYTPAIQLVAGDHVYEVSPVSRVCGLLDTVCADDHQPQVSADMFRSVHAGTARCAVEDRCDALCRVWAGSQVNGAERTGAGPTRSGVLLGDLQGSLALQEQVRADVSYQSSARVTANEAQQSDALEQESSEDEAYATAHRTQASGPCREWHRVDPRRGQTSSGVGRSLEVAQCYDTCQTRLRFPLPLQTGPCSCRLEARDRDRRVESQFTNSTSTGPQEGGLHEVARVDAVEVHQPGRDGTFGGLCADGHVYNIEVEGNHNYFVDDILVHNCHHAPAPCNLRALAKFDDALVMGLTATPDRSDGKGLGRVFHTVAYRYDAEQAIRDGYLAPPTRVLASSVRELMLLAGRRRTIVFADTVENSKAMAAALGPSAAHVDGKTPSRERRRVMTAFASGAIQYLCNCDLVTEGFDVPACEVAAVFRNVGSRGLLAQMIGRAMRPMPGKYECLLVQLPSARELGLVPPTEVLSDSRTVRERRPSLGTARRSARELRQQFEARQNQVEEQVRPGVFGRFLNWLRQ